MKQTFADTSYWVAYLWLEDQWRDAALTASEMISDSEIVTTESVLIEVLNYFSEFRADIKNKIAVAVKEILQDDETLVLHHRQEDFLNALELYKSRLDKSYSLTDCISMNVMRDFNITDILTNDTHFQQEGYTKLF